MRTIYRGGRVFALIWLVAGSVFAASGGYAMAADCLRAETVFACLLGGISLGAGVCVLVTRVAVDSSGLQKRSPLGGSFRVSWDEIDSWWVHLGNVDKETLPQACFKLQSRWQSEVVHNSDVGHPGFDAFLMDVRAHVGDRETADASAAGRAGV
jgi:hypothetical protein